jgi:CheY-like chemotaxis protein
VRLAQVFMNLLNNAAKYTDRGGRITLSADVRPDHVCVRVRDTGAGIAPEALKRVFELFYRADSSLERSSNGLGIGLSLVRRLVEAHGGSVSARSEGIGLGSEFAVTLPLEHQVADAKPGDRDADHTAGASPAGRRILVADDVKDAADSLAMLLELRGHDVRTAHDGDEAIEVAEAFRPHIVLLDIGMPKLNGYEACRRIRAQPWGRSIVMVALTGWSQAEDRRRTDEAGFDAHIVKPVEVKVLLDLLAAHCAGIPDEAAVGSEA